MYEPTQIDDAVQALLPGAEGRADRHSPDSSSLRFSRRGLVQVIAKMRLSQCSQCYSLHIACLFFSLILHFVSCLVHFIVPSATLVCRCQRFRTVLHLSQPTPSFPTAVSILSAGSFESPHLSHHLVLECGIHGQQNTKPAHVQFSCSTKSGERLRSNICNVIRCKNFLGTEISISYSLQHTKKSRVDVFCSWSSSQPIGQRIRL